eukprot:gnl/Trimastix_PCT/3599.p1 GENE.gnl/Trimastix_PCT/3599~~gnl/Trimastix_PCT/3599.p1  ORF type:complete len:195 (+),score=14.29 gnl/Trimastix_PCT/3599:50-634(+)
MDDPEILAASAFRATPEDSDDEGDELEFELMQFRTFGNLSFRGGEFEKAAEFYSQALLLCEPESRHRLPLLNNRSGCYIKLKRFEEALEDTQAAVSIANANITALYFQGKAYEGMNQPDNAIVAYESILARNSLEDVPSRVFTALEALSFGVSCTSTSSTADSSETTSTSTTSSPDEATSMSISTSLAHTDTRN